MLVDIWTGVWWCLDTFLKAFFIKLDGLMLGAGTATSLLGFSVGITILCIVIGAILLRV